MLQLDHGATAAGFRTQLLQRLRNQALREGIPVLRFQQRIAFERFLERPRNTGTERAVSLANTPDSP